MEIGIGDADQLEGGDNNSSSSFISLLGELIKSKQTALLVYTTVFTYLFSSWNMGIDFGFALLLIASLVLAVSGSTLLNMYIDRDIDAVMIRTKNRPIPSGKVSPTSVVVNGAVMVGLGLVLSWLFINPVTTAVIAAGFVLDVVVYSVWLKRKTPTSILFGGIAGGMPALAGRTAVVGQVDLVGVLLALFVIAWIPLHILTLAMLPENLEGYRRAGVPMWPVVRGTGETMIIVTLSAILSAVVVVMTGVVLNLHWLALLPLLLLSAAIVIRAAENLRAPDQDKTFWIFKAASGYMAFAFLWLFIGVVLTQAIGDGSLVLQLPF